MRFRNVQLSLSQGFTSDNQLCWMPHQLKIFDTDNMKALGQARYVVLGRDRRANALFSLAGLARGEVAPFATSKSICCFDTHRLAIVRSISSCPSKVSKSPEFRGFCVIGHQAKAEHIEHVNHVMA
jgi:hypothetical protein